LLRCPSPRFENFLLPKNGLSYFFLMRLELNPADIACQHCPSFPNPHPSYLRHLVQSRHRLSFPVRKLRIPAPRVQRRILESRHRLTLRLSAAFFKNPGLQIPAFKSRPMLRLLSVPTMRVAVVWAQQVLISHVTSIFFSEAVWAPQPHRAFRAAIVAAWAVTCRSNLT